MASLAIRLCTSALRLRLPENVQQLKDSLVIVDHGLLGKVLRELDTFNLHPVQQVVRQHQDVLRGHQLQTFEVGGIKIN
ncbi:MAG: hypothetical protein HIU84_06770 [Acidobacteria bacterium]|nr:hypothetical protein [Acidobacteriota bacterium]